MPDTLEAVCGKLGLMLCEELKPDILLLDLMMPEMNGDEMLEKMENRQDGHLKTLKTDVARSFEIHSQAINVQGGEIKQLFENLTRITGLEVGLRRTAALLSTVSQQQAIQKYDDVARNPQYAALQARPEFQQTLAALHRYGEVRTASNTAIQLPPPPLR